MPQDTNSGCLTALLQFFGLGNQKDIRRTTTTVDLEPETLPYLVRDDFFSNAEASFYRVLKNMAADHLVICPKVSLAEIFYVSRPNENGAYFNKINRKHVDFLLCDPTTLKPRLAIELDDSSHKREDRMERDDFVDEVFAAAGLSLMRVPVQAAYNTSELAELFKSTLRTGAVNESKNPEQETWSPDAPAPYCPKCGVQMVLRTAQRGSNAGKKFYGCPNYPRCSEIISVAR
jgi:hypothetical protein